MARRLAGCRCLSCMYGWRGGGVMAPFFIVAGKVEGAAVEAATSDEI